MPDYDEMKAICVLGKFDQFTHEQIFKWVEDGLHADPAFVALEIMIHKEVLRLVALNREGLGLMMKIHQTMSDIKDLLATPSHDHEIRETLDEVKELLANPPFHEEQQAEPEPAAAPPEPEEEKPEEPKKVIKKKPKKRKK
jgi:hypothetical protein